MIFVGQPLDLRKGISRPLKPLKPLGPLRYFGLPMVNPGRPPLPPNMPYRQPLNYPKYVKDFDPNALVKVFKVAIRPNGETKDTKNC